jgi:hypothetical protein
MPRSDQWSKHCCNAWYFIANRNDRLLRLVFLAVEPALTSFEIRGKCRNKASNYTTIKGGCTFCDIAAAVRRPTGTRPESISGIIAQ